MPLLNMSLETFRTCFEIFNLKFDVVNFLAKRGIQQENKERTGQRNHRNYNQRDFQTGYSRWHLLQAVCHIPRSVENVAKERSLAGRCKAG